MNIDKVLLVDGDALSGLGGLGRYNKDRWVVTGDYAHIEMKIRMKNADYNEWGDPFYIYSEF